MYLQLDSGAKQGLFWGYIFACSLQAVLLHKNGSGPVSSTSIVLMQEFFKLVFSVSVLRFKTGSWAHVLSQISASKKFFLLYMIPALFYSIYNNLAFIGLREFDPTTYFVLMQFRVVIVALFSILFLKKKISAYQWLGLFAVILGALCKIFDSSEFNTNSFTVLFGEKFVPFLLVQVQLLLAASAGIYNEYLLKGNSTNTETQNIFMYIDSILVGFVSGGFARSTRTFSGDPFLVSLVVINGATMGLLTAYFLRSLDSVRKSIASAIELWTTAILSSLVFKYPIGLNAIVGLAIVTIGVLLYSHATPVSPTSAPISRKPPSVKKLD